MQLNRILPKNYMCKCVCVFILISWFCAHSDAHSSAQSASSASGTTITTREKMINIGTIYTAQWTYYLIAHDKEIRKYGNSENWFKNWYNPHYDLDSFEYNLIRHTFAGHYYYLLYRSRNYTEANAFIWTFLSSLAFEFTIETVTERPSYQDLYQTPVFGTVLGVGVEKLSKYLHDTDTWVGHLGGYILNPFTLLPKKNTIFGAVVPQHDQVRLMLQWEYE